MPRGPSSAAPKNCHVALSALMCVRRLWLERVQAQCEHPTVEKTVRVLCDYYHNATSNTPAKEAELFWRGRTDVTRSGGGAAATASFEAHLPGVPGNYFLARQRNAKASE